MKYNGIIFDFNGTLFNDTEMHIEAWRQYSKKLRGYEFTKEEMVHNMLGRTNEEIIKYAIQKTPSKELVEKVAYEKEALYREMCLKNPSCIKLNTGAVELLDFLKENNVPINIATGSEINNLKFFIKIFKLDKWFDTEKIVYDDGTLNSKPHPDIYLKACKNINIEPQKCIVFEDALSGVESAKAANIGHIEVYPLPEKREFFAQYDGVDKVLKDFFEFDRNLINY